MPFLSGKAVICVRVCVALPSSLSALACVCVHATLIVFMCMYKTLRNSEALKQKT